MEVLFAFIISFLDKKLYETWVAIRSSCTFRFYVYVGPPFVLYKEVGETMGLTGLHSTSISGERKFFL